MDTEIAGGAAMDSAFPIKNAFFDVSFSSAVEPIFITDPQGKLLAANPSFADKTEIDVAEAIGEVPTILKSSLMGEDFYQTLMRSLTRRGHWRGEAQFERSDGTLCREWLSISSSRNADGDITHFIGYMSQPLNEHYYDLLTKLPNRLLLQDRLDFMINHARRNNDLMALLLIDIDRFKYINEAFGYDTGDTLLKTIAERLHFCVRDVDVVFRSGDDEFAVVLEEIGNLEDAAKVAERILNTCSGAMQINEHTVQVSVCMGISIFPTDGDCKAELLQNAETAILRARELGYNTYQHYMPSMNTRALERLTLENDLRNALNRNEMIVFYQPQVEISSGKIIGAEALLRWKHPDLGMIQPSRFIPIAEDSGLIVPIGEWVLRTACMQAKKWHNAGMPVIISINLSAKQFNQKNIVAVVESALKNSNIPPSQVELEITETMSMKNPENTLKILEKLKKLGVKIAIDDFGTGYSSLSYLKRFPIDTLKIDRTFLIDIPENSRDTEIVKAIIAMARSLNQSVIAEGIEREPQAKYLLENGCSMMQGYLFSPPVPIQEFWKLLDEQKFRL
ncbi:MAG: EAL domain-containing protein [Chitinispirillales bacterium]|nr:EAL domain-containing protein [Chitinispirillales bacterium]